jgi:hypothetical protein
VAGSSSPRLKHLNVRGGAENAEAGISLPRGVGLGLFPAGRRAGVPVFEAVEAGGGAVAELATVEAGVEVVEVAGQDAPALDTGTAGVEAVETDTVVVPDADGADGAVVEVVVVDGGDVMKCPPKRGPSDPSQDTIVDQTVEFHVCAGWYSVPVSQLRSI